MNKQNARIWKECGLTSDGAKLADRAMPLFLEAVRRCYESTEGHFLTADLAHAVFCEAVHQHCVLLTRTKAYQKKYRWVHPEGKR